MNWLKGSRIRSSRARGCFIAVLLLVASAVAAPGRDARAAEETQGAPKILITGASGGLAGETISAVLGRGVKLEDLILVSRTPENLAAYASRGAQVRAGDFDKPESLAAAFAGASRMLLISTSGGDRVAQHTAAISAARSAGVRHIVYTSFTNAIEDNPAAVARDHRLTEQALQRSGMAYTILRNQRYSDGLVAEAARAVAAGEIVSNTGRSKWAPVARQDCAAAAAIVLTTPGHEGKRYEITGPELINQYDIAKLVAEITGRHIRVVEVDDSAFIARAMQGGASEAAAKLSASFGIATRLNYLNVKSEALQILLGRKPLSVREMLLANKARLMAPPAAR